MIARLLASLALAGMALVASSSMAQPAAPTQVRGQVQSLEGNVLTVKAAAGATEVVMDGAWAVNVLKTIDVAQIQPGSFIGTTNVDKADGAGQSTEIHVFPPGVRAGEGHYPWQGAPGSMMTNGDVTMVVASAKGREMDIKYNGQGGSGVRHVVVPPGTPIVTFSPGDRTMLKPGWNVLIFAFKGPDGKLHAQGVTTGENGVAPPM
jgi:hypothetical protein